jgi:hypothetical protein
MYLSSIKKENPGEDAAGYARMHVSLDDIIDAPIAPIFFDLSGR